ncbi:MAG TPA: type IV secretion system DNA-binding domain-containing protein [Terriglobales bacterium]|nr:type IV secretion system DNA-binding domain-containing protein [Terriglobales bacterium]
MARKVSEIRKEHEAAGAFNVLINVCSFIDEHTFLTKSGDLGVVFKVQGIDYECLDHSEIDAFARRFEAALRSLTDEFRLYQYLLKRNKPAIPHREYRDLPVVDRAIQDRVGFLDAKAESLYSLELYFILIYEGWRRRGVPQNRLRQLLQNPDHFVRTSLSAEQQLTVLESELAQAQQALSSKVTSFLVQLRDLVNADLLAKAEAFRFFGRLLNYAPHRADHMRLKYDLFVDQQLAGSSLECHRDHLRLDDYHVKCLSVTEPPGQTFAHMLRALLELPANVIVASEWKRASNARVRKLIRAKRRHFHNSKTSLANYLHDSPPSERHLLVDDADESLVNELGLSLRELEVNGNYFGEWSMTVILYDADRAALDRSVAECIKVFATQDATVIEERYNLLNAWLSVLPGNHQYNLRRLYLLNTNSADLSLIFTLHTGEPHNRHLDQEYLAVLETNHGTPYYLNLHCEDNAHTVILGATGAGKSFLLNFLLTNLQKYRPYTVIFDLGGGYESLTRLFGGSYLQVGVEKRSFTINPFSLPPTKENLHFLYSFVRVLVESSGCEMTSGDERDLYEQIENLYQIEASMRRLFTLGNILNHRLAEHLHKWVGEGPYGSLFDNTEDNLTLAQFQCFDFEGMDKYSQVLEPLLFYILHRANASVHALDLATTFKVFVMDEAWRFFRNPTIKQYVVEALKTWRKKNAAMILATQSGDDLYRSELLPVIVESCATKIFLANPGMDRAAYRERFHLNETEAELVSRLIPKQQFLIKRPDLAKVVNLHVDPTGYWLYTNSPYDNARRREAFARHGFERGLEILAKETAA